VIEIEAFGIQDELVDRLRVVEGVESVTLEVVDQAQLIIVQSAHGAILIPRLLAVLDGASLGRVVAREPTLEDAYVRMVSRP
jgi:ABC-2 type transport system ATP-binding protein